MPKFANPETWQQAELLMQPAFIRVIDNIRKQLEQSSWKGTYRDVQVWAEGIPEETKAIALHLQQQLADATPEQAADIEEQLARLPQPYPGYELCLQKHDQQINIDLWQLCYQICFRNYAQLESGETETVEIDTGLIDETGDVDWQRLDAKAQQFVGQIFDDLSAIANS